MKNIYIFSKLLLVNILLKLIYLSKKVCSKQKALSLFPNYCPSIAAQAITLEQHLSSNANEPTIRTIVRLHLLKPLNLSRLIILRRYHSQLLRYNDKTNHIQTNACLYLLELLHSSKLTNYLKPTELQQIIFSPD